MWGTWGNDVPLPFYAGNPVPLVYTTAVGGSGGMWRTPASNPSLAENLNFDFNFKVTSIVNRSNCKSCTL